MSGFGWKCPACRVRPDWKGEHRCWCSDDLQGRTCCCTDLGCRFDRGEITREELAEAVNWIGVEDEKRRAEVKELDQARAAYESACRCRSYHERTGEHAEACPLSHPQGGEEQ